MKHCEICDEGRNICTKCVAGVELLNNECVEACPPKNIYFDGAK